ncbi:TIR domain-containing anti-phage reverse transcriptase [uncultured Maritimibacter sp.]|uniref:TIR domain-containing anti-phage reverse transcriptase n=1 Tax=uncultured Maritimibacter sp. TaxID=991866 RepID=UPI000A454F7C|nr:TIR domain-containing anti-phage reverse transcriptase [uncultured Maritimibacter sp.]
MLSTAHSFTDIAHALGLNSRQFFYSIQHVDDGIFYQEFDIPKRRGGVRRISKPVRGVALAQDRFAVVLEHVYRPGSYVRGFVRGQSFVSNAEYHKSQQWVLNIDLEDFFPSINFGRIRGIFMSRMFGFPPRVATILARLCTYGGVLPQGASTSPIIANIVAKQLDKKLVDLASREQVKYTRYSDDITFSSSKRSVPKAFVVDADIRAEGGIKLSSELHDAVRSSGFRLNSEKTRLMLRNSRQEVTGLIVNERTNVWRRDVSRMRKKFHSIRKFGWDDAAKYWGAKSAEHFRQQLIGWLAFVRQVRGTNDPVLARLCENAHSAGITEIKWIEELADMHKEFDVFLSHATEDKPRVGLLKAVLESRGIKVFYDEDSIKWGDSIVDRINHGLTKSVFFMPVLSDTFSRKGWTNKELSSAISSNASRQKRILPIRMDDFDIGDSYPLLNDTLYKSWPTDPTMQKAFFDEVADGVEELLTAEKSGS